MFKKKLVRKCLAFGLSFSIIFGGMSGVAVKAENAETMRTEENEEAAEVSEAWENADDMEGAVETDEWEDECPAGSEGLQEQEYGELVGISEKSADAESIALTRKEQKAAEKAAKKAEKDAEKEAKKAEKDAEKEAKKAEKEEKKQAKKLKKEKHEKTSVISSVEDYDDFWNIVAVGGTDVNVCPAGADMTGENPAGTDLTGENLGNADRQNSNPVKVAILDSGVDYTEDIDVYMRKNFIPGQDEVSVIYEDLCGHGTSVAGIIAAKDNDEGITGINPNVQLYSARILDENKQAPVSRVVEAIDWTIEQDVDIINISFGTLTDSEELHAAIQRAYNHGILIVAAAGNNGVVEYPAAYDEVIAVGAVNAAGERAAGSAVGDELELVAPGEQIVSTGAFGGVCVVGGTSLAAPHVTAAASVLWEKDRAVSADFIRSLLAFSANQYGEDYEYGYGLVDLEFALSQYDAFREVYVADESLNEQVEAAVEDGTLEVNEKAVEEFEDVAYVEGSWYQNPDGSDTHKGFAEVATIYGRLTGDKLTIVKLGAVAQDSILKGMKIHSEWHGFFRRATLDSAKQPNGDDKYTRSCSNYVFAYIYLTEIAKGVAAGKSPSSISNSVSTTCIDTSTCDLSPNCTALAVANIKNKFTSTGIKTEDKEGNSTGTKTWASLLGNNEVNNQNKSLFIYGMALHALTDTFAHSSCQKSGTNWSVINHGSNASATGADNTATVPNRYECATFIARYAVQHILKTETGSVEDYYSLFSSSVYTGDFRLANLKEFINAVDSSYYNQYKSTFDSASYFVKIEPNEDDY